MKLKKLLKVCEESTLISVLDLTNNVRAEVCTINEFKSIYKKEVLNRKILHIEFKESVVLIDIF